MWTDCEDIRVLRVPGCSACLLIRPISHLEYFTVFFFFCIYFVPNSYLIFKDIEGFFGSLVKYFSGVDLFLMSYFLRKKT